MNCGFVCTDTSTFTCCTVTMPRLTRMLGSSVSTTQLPTCRIVAELQEHESLPPLFVCEVKAMDALVQSGSIRRWGTSNWSVDRILQAVDFAQKHGLASPNVASNQFSLAVPCSPIWPGTTHLTEEGGNLDFRKCLSRNWRFHPCQLHNPFRRVGTPQRTRCTSLRVVCNCRRVSVLGKT